MCVCVCSFSDKFIPFPSPPLRCCSHPVDRYEHNNISPPPIPPRLLTVEVENYFPPKCVTATSEKCLALLLPLLPTILLLIIIIITVVYNIVVIVVGRYTVLLQPLALRLSRATLRMKRDRCLNCNAQPYLLRTPCPHSFSRSSTVDASFLNFYKYFQRCIIIHGSL